MLQQRIMVYGNTYRTYIRRSVVQMPDAPRLVVVGYQPNEAARDILKLCVASIQRFTPEAHELWVVDNCSPPAFSTWLETVPGVNVIFNRTLPFPRRRLWDRLLKRSARNYSGSYANAVALELAAEVIDPATRLMMTLHMDTMACRSNWLTYLCSHINDHVRSAGVRRDTFRVITNHVLGMVFDFTLFRPRGMTFMHNMPSYDVGDGISVALQNAGYELWACRNTLVDQGLVELLASDSLYRSLYVDRALDDCNEVIFMHLGRGIKKSGGMTPEGKTSPEEWLCFGREVVLAT